MVSTRHSMPASQGHPLSAGSCTGAQAGSAASSMDIRTMVDDTGHGKHGCTEMWRPTCFLTDFVDGVQGSHERLADRGTSGKQAKKAGRCAAASALSAIPGLDSLSQSAKPLKDKGCHRRAKKGEGTKKGNDAARRIKSG
ncbi:hypothetical protein CORC01_01582 [Colletotrichum orchidophilum]|uniref:Uncharacterized protein n=1 Tax=Colletotrichum orchidophilum TaxID=1209926 RepID=A0A1G4BPH2_9PEZI|nr:uncharacterized protein CORC01_01582 [Colletotrichum orchidophilum]OHF03198.1 hypothetical protein CORC01_01582 [Colletotrichum orchidophilum]